MSEPIIRTEHLSRFFGTVKALDDLSLEVPAGIVFGFLEPNGAGKTTTIHLLLGLLEPTKGTVRQAQQILIVATMVLVVGGVLALKAVPAQTLSSLSASQLWLIVMAVLAVLDAILLGALLVSFRRSRLILS
ncbi:MAG: ATP-binding cassette domain-containing protein [Ktedonobacteraceae bacterium]